jgi:hypothetical protein
MNKEEMKGLKEYFKKRTNTVCLNDFSMNEHIIECVYPSQFHDDMEFWLGRQMWLAQLRWKASYVVRVFKQLLCSIVARVWKAADEEELSDDE